MTPLRQRMYQLFLIKEKKVSLPTYIQMVCALRFLYTRRECGNCSKPVPTNVISY